MDPLITPTMVSDWEKSGKKAVSKLLRSTTLFRFQQTSLEFIRQIVESQNFTKHQFLEVLPISSSLRSLQKKKDDEDDEDDNNDENDKEEENDKENEKLSDEQEKELVDCFWIIGQGFEFRMKKKKEEEEEKKKKEDEKKKVKDIIVISDNDEKVKMEDEEPKGKEVISIEDEDVEEEGEAKDDDEEENVNSLEKQKERFYDLLKFLILKKVVSSENVKQRLEIKMLDEMNLIHSKLYKNQKSNILTVQSFCQKKYNLLSEESEGFAKFVLEFQDVFGLEKIGEKVERLKEIIGIFLLDPNKIVDVILTIFHNDLKNYMFGMEEEEDKKKKKKTKSIRRIREEIKKLSDSYKKIEDNLVKKYLEIMKGLFLNKLVHLKKLIFNSIFLKLKYNKLEKNEGLYMLIAVLVKFGIISLQEIYGTLNPVDRSYVNMIKEYVHKEKNESSKVTIRQQDQHDFSVCGELIMRLESPIPFSEKLELLKFLLMIGDEKSSSRLSRVLFVNGYNFSLNEEIRELLFRELNKTVDILYNAMKEGSEDETILDPEVLNDSSGKMQWLITYLGPVIGTNVKLFFRLVRYLSWYFFEHKKNDTESFETGKKICLILMSSLCCLPSPNVGLTAEVWDLILKKFDFKLRFDIYAGIDHLKKENLFIHRSFHISSILTSRILKKVVKENVRNSGRDLSKIYCMNPVACVRKVIGHLYYGIFIELNIEMLKYSNEMVRDILVYRILSRLSDFSAISGEEFLHKFNEEDKYSPSDIIKHYGQFTALLMSKYYSTFDLKPIFEFILNEVTLGSWMDLYMFRQLVEKVSGEEMYDGDIKDQQMESLSGGHILRMENSFQSSLLGRKKRFKSIKYLVDWFCRDKNLYAYKFIEILSKLRKKSSLFSFKGDLEIEYKERFKKILYCIDKCQETFLIFLQFLKCNCEFKLKGDEEEVEKSKKLQNIIYLPNLQTLSNWKLENEICFYILSPIILKKYINNSNLESFFEDYKANLEKIIPNNLFSNKGLLKYYILFWSLNLYDINVPHNIYKITVGDLYKKLNKTNSDVKSKEKKSCETVINKLKEEEKEQERHVKQIHEFIAKDFKVENVVFDIGLIVQHFIYPRIVISTSDALYSSYYIEKFLDTPDFPMYKYLRTVFEYISSWLMFSTEYESVRMARFFRKTLNFLRIRLKEKKLFKNRQVIKDFDEFNLFVYRIHGEFTHYFMNSFKNIEKIEIKKAFVRVLNQIKVEYPVYQIHASAIFEHLKREEKDIIKEEEAVYRTYIGFLEKKIKNREFNQNPPVIKRKSGVPSSSRKRKRSEEKNSTKEEEEKTTPKRRKLERPKIEVDKDSSNGEKKEKSKPKMDTGKD